METKETACNADTATALVREAGRCGRGFRVLMVALAVMAAGLFPVAPVAAQATGTITGTVADAETGAPVASAQIGVPALGIGVLSSGSGRFTLPAVPVGTHELRADRLGFATESMEVTDDGSKWSRKDFCLASTNLSRTPAISRGTSTSTVVTRVYVDRSALSIGPTGWGDEEHRSAQPHGMLGTRHVSVTSDARRLAAPC